MQSSPSLFLYSLSLCRQQICLLSIACFTYALGCIPSLARSLTCAQMDFCWLNASISFSLHSNSKWLGPTKFGQLVSNQAQVLLSRRRRHCWYRRRRRRRRRCPGHLHRRPTHQPPAAMPLSPDHYLNTTVASTAAKDGFCFCSDLNWLTTSFLFSFYHSPQTLFWHVSLILLFFSFFFACFLRTVSWSVS